MKKTWIAVLLGACIIAAVGFGIQQTFANPSGGPMSIEEARKIVTDQYPGNVTEVELDKEKGRQVYEVELINAQGEYEVKLDAVTGEILKVKQEIKGKGWDSTDHNQQAEDGQVKENTQTNGKETTTSSKLIGLEEAKRIALEKAPGTVKEVDLDHDDGILVYEIEIITETGEAEFEINAYTGEIVYMSIENELD